MGRVVSRERIWRDIEAIGSFGRGDAPGRTSFSYSDQDVVARRYLTEQMRELGMSISADGVGNIRGRLNGSDGSLAPVMSGSHIDSVACGGDYDGVVGVVAALEVARCIAERKIELLRPYEVAIFSEEEGSNFGVTCAGSKVMTGALDVEGIKKIKDADNVSMYDRCIERGFDPESLHSGRVMPGQIHGMVELHIEQSVLLESQAMQIGVVQSIAGLCQCKLTFRGTANHAGSTPMNLRQDALVGASRFVVELEKLVRDDPSPSVVGTVGAIQCEPNASNVIPGIVIISLDVRDVFPDAIDRVIDVCQERARLIAVEKGLDCSFEILGRQSPVALSPKICKMISECSDAKGLRWMPMNSGAVHDSVLLSSVTETGLIFVPSKAGKSHCPDEYTDMDEIADGAEVLLSTIVALANS
ncbi:MAG: Zn-dependent hydrolase [Dethiosulfovibrio peptidovorans]|nr:MAG: Zn-dependent hydrolase [Dethiosulfovibrio peptidovorans]